MKKYLNHYAVLLFLALMCACAQVGITPTTFNEKLAVAYTTVTAVRTSTTTLLQAKKITADDAQNVQTSAYVARTGLDVARKLSATDMTGATAKLTAITSMLTAMQTYLASKGG